MHELQIMYERLTVALINFPCDDGQRETEKKHHHHTQTDTHIASKRQKDIQLPCTCVARSRT